MNRRLIRAAALAGASLAVGAWSSGGRGRRVDERAFRALNAGAGPGADRCLSGVTEMGSLWAAGGAALALAASGRRDTAGRAFSAAAATWALGQGLKRVFDRPRPYEALGEDVRLMIGRPHASSWPSSHPAVLATFLTVAVPELRLGSLARLAAGGLTAAVGISRPYLGVHYPSDVAGGLLMGRAVGLVWRRGR